MATQKKRHRTQIVHPPELEIESSKEDATELTDCGLFPQGMTRPPLEFFVGEESNECQNGN